MQIKEVYLDQVLSEVEKLTSQVAFLKERFANQSFNVQLECREKLHCVHARFADFKRSVWALEEADEFEVERNHVAVEGAWNDLVEAVDALLSSLSASVESRKLVM